LNTLLGDLLSQTKNMTRVSQDQRQGTRLVAPMIGKTKGKAIQWIYSTICIDKTKKTPCLALYLYHEA